MRSPAEGARRITRVSALVLDASRTYRIPPHAVLRRAVELHYRRGYALEEARLLGLLDPALTDEQLADRVPRSELRRLQRRLNPSNLAALTEDKGIFDRVCRLADLPTPAAYAVVGRDGGGWTLDGSSPRTPHEWADALERILPDEFVAKPTDGHFGIGVRVLRRSGAGFAEGDEQLGGADELYESLLAGRDHAAIIFQERLLNHRRLLRLSGSPTLQTVRVLTVLDGRGRASVLGAFLKVAAGDGPVDNFRDGATGNGLAAVDLDEGTLGPLLVPHGDRGRYVEIDRHPRTGFVVTGVRLPHWQAALQLARRAAQLFEPIRTIGWDVALAPDRPVLVEGNMWWGPPNEFGLMPTIMQTLRAAADATPDVRLTPELRADTPRRSREDVRSADSLTVTASWHESAANPGRRFTHRSP